MSDNTKTNKVPESHSEENVYKPDLSIKKPSELQKVTILEEVVLNGTLEDLKNVLNTYKSFEITARALGLAARYRSVDFVQTLLKHGASFKYAYTPDLQRKYSVNKKHVRSCDRETDYYMMIVPSLMSSIFDFENTYGISAIDISSELKNKSISLNDRVEATKLLAKNKKCGISLEKMLYCALLSCEFDFADALIDMGVSLTRHDIYVISDSHYSVDRQDYMWHISKMKAQDVTKLFERLNPLVTAKGGKVSFANSSLESGINWNDESLALAIENNYIDKIDKNKALQLAVSINAVSALEKMAGLGWLSRFETIDQLIDFSNRNKYSESLAWLLDYKNKSFDLVAEELKKEAKIMKELTEDPNSVTALKRIWSYKKLDDGTLEITSYKGSKTEIEVPAMIGKSKVTSIGEYSFSPFMPSVKNEKERKKIESVKLSDSVTSIGDSAFSGCSSLTSIEIPDSVKSIGSYAFGYCSSLTNITIPDSVKSIGSRAFSGCSLTRIEIPDSVKSIGSYVFDGCSSLTGVFITNIDAWLKIKFGERSSNPLEYAHKLYLNNELVTDIVLSDKAKKINDHAFHGCNSIKSITIPDNVTSIGDSAFSGCSSLTSASIGNGVTSIGGWAFYGCSSLTSIVIPDSVKNIGDSAFENCSSLTSIEIPDSVTSIDRNAFSNCSSLTSITIPDSVKSIGDYAFSGCSSLTSIEIPDGVTDIGDRAFNDAAYYNNSSNWEKDVLYIGNHLIKAKTLISGSYVIKDGTKCIADHAFYNCSSLTSIEIPDSVKSIGWGAFANCSSLTSIEIPDSVTSIGSSAFSGCSSITSINIPDSVTSIGEWAFFGCISLTSIVIPDSVTSIGKSAFEDCSSITSINIPDSVTSIGDDAFEDCSNLTSIVIPNSVKSIGLGSFSGCSRLKNVTIPEGVYCDFGENVNVTRIPKKK